MGEFLHWLLVATLKSSIVIVVVLGLRPLISKRWGATAACSLWWAPLAAMVFPGYFTPLALPPSGVDFVLSALSIRGPALHAHPPGFDAMLFGLWLSGAVTWLVWAGMRQWMWYRRMLSSISPAPHWIEQRWQALAGSSIGVGPALYCACIQGPLLLGIWRPRLLLPADFLRRFSADGAEWVLRHEAAHVARRDIPTNLLLEFARALFWFNPLLHLGVRRFHIDQELACDARALRGASSGQRRAYAVALLKSTLAGAPAGVLCLSRTTQNIQERIQMLTQSSRHGRLAGVAVTLLIVSSAVFGITVGGGAAAAEGAQPVIGAQSMPVAVHRQNPLYPRSAAEGKIEGHVSMRFTIEADGSVSGITVTESSPPGVFDHVATTAMSQWRFKPMPVPVNATQTMDFEMDH